MAWMRQKGGETPATNEIRTGRVADPAAVPRVAAAVGAAVTIGRTVTLKGELSGDEDVTIDGVVDGRVDLSDHQLTIGPNGRVTAQIHAKCVRVSGRVDGNIVADDKVEIGPTGVVRGDIRAPRVAIADGAKFKGSIDMEPKAAGAAIGGRPTVPGQTLPRSAHGA